MGSDILNTYEGGKEKDTKEKLASHLGVVKILGGFPLIGNWSYLAYLI